MFAKKLHDVRASFDAKIDAGGCRLAAGQPTGKAPWRLRVSVAAAISGSGVFGAGQTQAAVAPDWANAAPTASAERSGGLVITANPATPECLADFRAERGVLGEAAEHGQEDRRSRPFSRQPIGAIAQGLEWLGQARDDECVDCFRRNPVPARMVQGPGRRKVSRSLSERC